jgi:hypothetical protein
VANQASNTVSVFLNNGDGTFHRAPDLPVAGGPREVAVGDLNQDGVPDIVTTEPGANQASVLLGKGNGAFQPAVTYSVGLQNPQTVVIGRFNSDSYPDLAVANYGPS